MELVPFVMLCTFGTAPVLAYLVFWRGGVE